MVTITEQRSHKFLLEQNDIKRWFTSSEVRLSGLRPEPFQLHWPYCRPGLRERETLAEKRLFFPGCTFTIFYRGSSRT